MRARGHIVYGTCPTRDERKRACDGVEGCKGGGGV